MTEFKLSKYLSKHKFAIFSVIFFSTLSAACITFSTLGLAEMVGDIAKGDLTRALYDLIFVLCSEVLKRISYYFFNLAYYKGSAKLVAAMSIDLTHQALKINSLTYNNTSTGQFTQRIITYPSEITDQLSELVDLITNIINYVVVIIYVTFLSPIIGSAIIAAIIIGLIIEFFRLKKTGKPKKEVKKASEALNSFTTEIIKSEKDIKSIGLEAEVNKKAQYYNENYNKKLEHSNIFNMNFWSLRNTIVEILSVGSLFLGIYLMNKGLLTLSIFMIIYSNNSYNVSLIWCIGEVSNVLQNIKIAKDRMASLFDESEFATERFGNVHLDNVKGEIEFKNVSYTFYEYEDEKLDKKDKRNKKRKPQKKVVAENKIFDNLNFKIEPNTTVAFVGKSGSGKSTILNLISKMFEVNEGEVLIDGVNINDLDKETLRSAISLVNQFPYIFDMTIKENLMLAKPDATDDEINKALKQAALDEFINSLPKAIDTRVGEGGIKLSGGQKQRLAIARALLRNSTIIIFDESTSSLDNFAQNDVKKSIDALKGKSTIVIVAHRLSTIKDVDKIYFLDEGKVIDSGTFDELFKKNKKFKNMFLSENI